jgi:hypothetical protein
MCITRRHHDRYLAKARQSKRHASVVKWLRAIGVPARAHGVPSFMCNLPIEAVDPLLNREEYSPTESAGL